MIEPGQTYDRAGVVVLVLRKRSGPPEDWAYSGVRGDAWAKKQVNEWYDVLNLASDTSLDFHTPGRIVSWHVSLFDPCRSTRYG